MVAISLISVWFWFVIFLKVASLVDIHTTQLLRMYAQCTYNLYTAYLQRLTGQWWSDGLCSRVLSVSNPSAEAESRGVKGHTVEASNVKAGGGSKSSSYQSGNPKRDVTFGSPEGI